MSEHVDDAAPFEGAAVSDDDIRGLLDQERKASAALKLQLEQERSERTRAQAQVSTAQASRFESEETAIKARLETAEAQAVSLKKQYAEALAEGRFDEVADLQDKMGELRAKQAQDRQYQVWLEAEKARLKAAPPPQQPQNQGGIDLASYSPAQRQWIRKNPDFMTDAQIRQRTFAGHQLAVADGIEIDSPEYFEVIDDVVARGAPRAQARQPVQQAQQPEADPPPRRQRAEPSHEMPVTRNTAQGGERGAKAVRLSADQMEAADIAMAHVPVEGHKDAQGRWVPGRYERYVINSQKLRARNGQ